MELICLFCLYYLSQNPQFSENVKPLLFSLKNSEQMLKFINDLSQFSEFFSALTPKGEKQPEKKEKPPEQPKEHAEKTNEKSSSPTEGIAGEFIEEILNNYFKNR